MNFLRKLRITFLKWSLDRDVKRIEALVAKHERS